MVRITSIWIDSEAWTQGQFNIFVLKCDVFGFFMASDKCWTCPGRGLGGKGTGANGDMSDKEKKDLESSGRLIGLLNETWVSSGKQMLALRLANHKKGKRKKL